MRALAVAALLALAAPAVLANHAVYVDETRIMSCLLLVQSGGVLAGVNCPFVTRSANAAEAPGGQYRLTVTWAAAAPEWVSLRADLTSCHGPCAPAATAVCVNANCVGNPNPANVVQQAANLGPSPLVVVIPTAGAEDVVTFTIRPGAPAIASLQAQGVRYVLDHVG